MQPQSTRRQQRRQAMVAAVVCGLVLALLAAAVVSIASRSREVANESVTLHALDESLRSITVARSQIAFATYLSSVDQRFGSDSDTAIDLSIREGSRGLLDLDAALSAIESEQAFEDGATHAALTEFTDTSNEILALLERDDVDGARALVGEQLIESFEALRTTLATRRDETLSRVVETDGLLGRIGGLASFMVAFIVPAVAIFVYRRITRRSRETVELTIELARERNRWKRRRQLLEQPLAELREALASVDDTTNQSPTETRRLADDLETLVTLLDGAVEYVFRSVPVAAELELIAAELRADGVEATVQEGDWQAWADPAALRHVLRNLALEIRESGAREAHLGAAEGDGHLKLSVSHDGARLPVGISAVLFERATLADRSLLDAGAVPVRLIAAQELLEGMGGALGYSSADTRPAFLVRISAAPADVASALKMEAVTAGEAT